MATSAPDVNCSPHNMDLSNREPIIVVPPDPPNIRNLVDYVGLEVNTGYFGSYAFGRLEELRAAFCRLRTTELVRPIT